MTTDPDPEVRKRRLGWRSIASMAAAALLGTIGLVADVLGIRSALTETVSGQPQVVASTVQLHPTLTASAASIPSLYPSSDAGSGTGAGTGPGAGSGGGQVPSPPTAPASTGGTSPVTNPPAGSKIGDFVDDWSAGGGRWQSDSAQIRVTGGQVRLDSVAKSIGTYIFEAKTRYDFTGSHVSIELVSAGNREGGFFVVPLSTGDPENEEVRWEISGDKIFARVFRNSVRADVREAPYSAAAHRYLAISENGGTFTWRTSGNGSSWSTFATAPVSGMSLTAVRTRVYGGTWAADTEPTSALFDNFNCRIPGMTSRC